MQSLSKKICLLGDFAVGKTSLVRRFIYDAFEDKYLSTIGVKVSRKVIALARDHEVVELTLILWDLAGSEEFDDVRVSYLRGAAGAVVVGDLTRPGTLGNMAVYAQELLSIHAQAQLVFVGNKVDLATQPAQSAETLAALATQYTAPHYLTSAKTGFQVEDLFRHLGQRMID